MLLKQNRLKKDKEFALVFKSAKPVYCGNLAVRARFNNLGLPRFGFVISNKTEKSAVKRNRMRRQLRAIARQLIPGIKKGYDVVAVVKKPYEQSSFDLIEADFQNCLFKLRVTSND